MEDETSNDVETINSSYNDDETTMEKAAKPNDKPLLTLIKNLIRVKDNKQSTVLTNTQIIEILSKEFNLDACELQRIELNIYMNIMKKYLKDWPKWDQFDSIVTEKLQQNDEKGLEEILEKKYDCLKEYLGVMLNISKPMAKETALTVAKSETSSNTGNDVVMEVQCSHAQLTQLFYRRPNPQQYNTIFNISETPPSRITLNTFTLDTILNWWLVSIQLSFNVFSIKYDNVIKLQHTLINRKLKENLRRPPTRLSQDIEIKTTKKYQNCSQNKTVAIIKKCQDLAVKLDPKKQIEIMTIFNFFLSNLSEMGDHIISQAKYRKYLNEFAYVRYFYTDVPGTEGDTHKFDLQVEEKLSPSYEIYIGKIADTPKMAQCAGDWLQIKCLFCNVIFYGIEEIEKLNQHFSLLHQYESDWQCSNCNLMFSMSYLANAKWNHEC